MGHKITDLDTVISVEGTEWHGLALHHPNITIGDIGKTWGMVAIEEAEHNGLRIPDTNVVLVDETPVSTVGERYTATDTDAIMNAVSAILDLDNRFHLTTVGTVDHRRDAFACISFGRDIKIGRNDLIKPYFTMIDNRTGARRFQIGENATRPVCANTVAVARGELSIGCRHTAKLDDFIAAIVAEFEDKYRKIEALEEDIHRLVDTCWDEDTRMGYVERFIPAKPKPEAKRQTKGYETSLRVIRERVAMEADITGLPADSAWLWYNGVTYNEQHGRTIQGDRLAARWTGSVAKRTEEALPAALALCEN